MNDGGRRWRTNEDNVFRCYQHWLSCTIVRDVSRPPYHFPYHGHRTELYGQTVGQTTPPQTLPPPRSETVQLQLCAKANNNNLKQQLTPSVEEEEEVREEVTALLLFCVYRSTACDMFVRDRLTRRQWPVRLCIILQYVCLVLTCLLT